MDYLEPPWQFFRIEPEHPIIIPVVRYQVGLAQRPIADPPGWQEVMTIRFHLPGPAGWGLQPYVDFGNRILVQKVLRLYNERLRRWGRQVPFPNPLEGEQLLPQRPGALRLEMTRHGERIDTWYDVAVVEV
jgi:hypothetical protein